MHAIECHENGLDKLLGNKKPEDLDTLLDLLQEETRFMANGNVTELISEEILQSVPNDPHTELKQSDMKCTLHM